MELQAEKGKVEGNILSYGNDGGCFIQNISISPEDKYLIADITNMEETSVVVDFAFWSDGDDPDILIRCGIFPKIKTHIVMPLKYLDGQQLFIPPSGMVLKCLVLGIRAERDKVRKIGIKTNEYYKDVKLQVDNFYLSSYYSFEPLDGVKLVDDLGQWATKDWEGKTKSFEEFSIYIKKEIKNSKNFDQFNYKTDVKFKATGFFRIEKVGNRFCMVSPDGKPFFSSGIDSIRHNIAGRYGGLEKFFEYLPKDDPEIASQTIANSDEGKVVIPCASFVASNFKRVFGSQWKQNWNEYINYKINSWGFNTIAAWSDSEFIKHSKMPYTAFLSSYPTTKNTVYRDFPDVFSDEYVQNSNEYAKQLEAYKNDENLIGYFMSNEPHFAFVKGLSIACELLKNPLPLQSKEVLIEFYKERYNGSIDVLNEKWETNFLSFEDLKQLNQNITLSKNACDELHDFSKILIEQYIKIPALELKKIDKNHLNLGIRFAWISSDTLFSGSQYVDAFSINCYGYSCSDEVNTIFENTGKPVIIGEYHFGSTDRGLPATGIRAAKSQNERGVAASYYLENAIANPYCIGVHYFQLYDQNILGRPDGENYQIGLLDVCSKEYSEITNAYKKTHENMYDIMFGVQKPTDVMAEEIPSIYY